MEKNFSQGKYIFLMIIALIFIITGFALKHQANKRQESGAIQKKETESENNVGSHPETGQLTTIDGVPISALGYDAEDTPETYYDYSQVPTRVDGVNMRDNQEWLAYYARCRNADAYVCEYNLSSRRTVNNVVISGDTFHIPFSTEDLPETGMVNEISHSIANSSEQFYGSTFCHAMDGIPLAGNKVYIQTYPGTDTVNAVSIDLQGMAYQEDSITAEIAGIHIGMKESEVISKYGEGTPSSNFASRMLQEERGIEAVIFQSTIYKNASGILVVTYDENRLVISVSLYTDELHRDLSEEKMIEVYEQE